METGNAEKRDPNQRAEKQPVYFVFHFLKIEVEEFKIAPQSRLKLLISPICKS